MRRLLSFLLLLVAVSINAPMVFADDPRAQEILKQARAAAGGEEQLQKVQGVQITGQYRRVFGERQMGGDREISILLPGKFLVEDSMSMGGMSTSNVNTKVLNGEQAWNANSGGGGGMVFRMGPSGQQISPEQMETLLRRQFRIELTRYLLALMLTPPESFPLEYKYAGESDVDDAKVDVIDATGPDKFAIRIYFDKESRLPLLLSYRGVKPRIMTMNRPAGSGGGAVSTARPEDIKKAQEDAHKKLAETPPVPEEVEFYIRLADHKKVSGVTLPHKLTFLTESEVSEELEIKKYQLNPQFKADKFEKH
jgi:hypothetical protein